MPVLRRGCQSREYCLWQWRADHITVGCIRCFSVPFIGVMRRAGGFNGPSMRASGWPTTRCWSIGLAVAGVSNFMRCSSLPRSLRRAYAAPATICIGWLQWDAHQQTAHRRPPAPVRKFSIRRRCARLMGHAADGNRPPPSGRITAATETSAKAYEARSRTLR